MAMLCLIGMVISLFTQTSLAQDARWVAKTMPVHDIELASYDLGRIEKVNVSVGQSVTAGTELVVLDSDSTFAGQQIATIQRQIAKTESENDIELRYANKSRDVLVKNVERSRLANLQYPQSIPDIEIEQQRLEKEQAELSAELAQQKIAINQNNLNLRVEEESLAKILHARRTLRAPIDGIVVELKKDAGESVAAGETVLRIVNLDRLRLVSRLEQNAISRIAVGDSVRFFPQRDTVKDLVVIGKITFISPELNPEEEVVEIWAEFDNHELGLLIGEKGELAILD